MEEQFAHETGGAGRQAGGKVIRIAGLTLAGIGAVALFAALFGWLVMVLWNWLMPSLFGVKAITFWQGFGVLFLAKLLFGGVGPRARPRHDRWRRRFRGRCYGVDDEGGKEGEGTPMPGDKYRWPLFRQFWRERGRAAFEAYAKEKNGQKD